VPALDFLEPLAIAQYRLAKDISVPARRINEIVHGTRAISADTSIALAARTLRPRCSRFWHLALWRSLD
jgi:addiction module HigA family antidote